LVHPPAVLYAHEIAFFPFGFGLRSGGAQNILSASGSSVLLRAARNAARFAPLAPLRAVPIRPPPASRTSRSSAGNRLASPKPTQAKIFAQSWTPITPAPSRRATPASTAARRPPPPPRCQIYGPVLVPPGFCCLPVSCSGAPKLSLWGTKTGAMCGARGMF
jgi:hypothetical protein